MPYPIFVGSERQQVIKEPNQVISAWCLVSPSMSLFPTPDDEYQILPVEATIVEKNLSGKKLSNPDSISIKYINPFTGMDKYEILPLKSSRFNVRAKPSSTIVYQDLDRQFSRISRPIPIISSNALVLIFGIITVLSIENNRNN
ncbi:MAG: hypothetical protein HOC18_10960 [Candidatus Marinimicrobia bacterium]|jgi:hypothetical protein|nr:hypothetical protein [Candidatus Neomarinimicrobiota bacterium]